MTDDEREKLNQLIAVEVFGWRWISFVGVPVRGSPGYPKKCRIRRFVSPELLVSERWMKHFERVGGYSDAVGDEPLDYSYCSSQGPELCPDFVGHFFACNEVMQHPNWPKVRDTVLSATIGGDA